ncbi:MAG: ROK family protein [Candidatus Eremiobacteraeota bacterium]|nr:ROK family protein [Candidatus Eremiobacteraeota bacterium]
MDVFGGIEAGGTKFVCAVGSGPDDIRAQEQFSTTTPEETLGKTIEFFKEQMKKEDIKAIGIATFGPADPDPDSPTYGYITSTPKPGWRNTDFAGNIKEALNLPVGFDTDVNGAAQGEYIWGAAGGLDTFIYLTIGTGLGGGGMVRGKLIHGLIHPEMGHMRIPHDREKDPYQGKCPYHGDCLEGLACGPAIEERWGQKAHTLPPDHPAWDLEAHYLALGLHNLICTLSPRRIIMGGGVMKQSQLFPKIRKKVLKLLNGYIQSPEILEHIDRYIVPPGLGERSGVLGAIALAKSVTM